MLKWLAKKYFGNTKYFKVIYGNEKVNKEVNLTLLELIELLEHCNKEKCFGQIRNIEITKIKRLLEE